MSERGNIKNIDELGMTLKDKKDIGDTLKILSLLANPTRFKMAYLLSKEEMCNRDLEKILDVEQTLVSHYLRDFKELKLTEERREGKWRYYSINDHRIMDIFKAVKLSELDRIV